MDHIVFYDGDCGLCQRSISFLSRIDGRKELLFAPLNGETYDKFFSHKSELTSVLFYSHQETYIKSDAVIEVLKHLGGWGILAYALQMIPRFIRNYVYDIIAGQRKKCFMCHTKERPSIFKIITFS